MSDFPSFTKAVFKIEAIIVVVVGTAIFAGIGIFFGGYYIPWTNDKECVFVSLYLDCFRSSSPLPSWCASISMHSALSFSLVSASTFELIAFVDLVACSYGQRSFVAGYCTLIRPLSLTIVRSWIVVYMSQINPLIAPETDPKE